MKIKYVLFFIFIIIVVVLGTNIDIIKTKNKGVESYVDPDEYRWIKDYFDKVVVITLPEREENVKSAMKNLKIEAELFEAIKKDKLDIEQMKRDEIITKDCKLNNGRIACHLSHLSVIRRFLEDPYSDTILIFEDDLLDNKGKDLQIVKDTIKNVMNNIPSDWDLVYFGKCWDLCDDSIKINDYVNKSYPLCRHGYGVSKKGASKILEYCLPIINKNGDVHIRDLSKEGKLNIYTPNINIFEQNRDTFGTNLGNYNKIKLCSKSKNPFNFIKFK